MKRCVQRFPPEPLCHCHSKAFVFWKMFSSAVRVLSLNFLSNPDTPPKEVRNLVACSMMPSSTKVPRSRSRGDAFRESASRSTAALDAVNPGGASAIGGPTGPCCSPGAEQAAALAGAGVATCDPVSCSNRPAPNKQIIMRLCSLELGGGFASLGEEYLALHLHPPRTKYC